MNTTTHCALLCVALLALCASATPAHADFVGSKCVDMTAKNITLHTAKMRCTGFSVKGRRIDFPSPISGRVVSSADGRSVVAFESYPTAMVNSTGTVMGWHKGKKVSDPVAYRFYRDGKATKTYRYSQLIRRPKLLRHSTSHLGWVKQMPNRLLRKRFAIETTSFESVEFDSTTGAMLSTQDSEKWHRCDRILTGSVDRKKLRLQRAVSLKGGGSLKFPYEFVISKTLLYTQGLTQKRLSNLAHIQGCFVESPGQPNELVGLVDM